MPYTAKLLTVDAYINAVNLLCNIRTDNEYYISSFLKILFHEQNKLYYLQLKINTYIIYNLFWTTNFH